MEGREEGRAEEKMRLIHVIHQLEQWLQLPEAPAKQLAERTPEELELFVDQLLSRMPKNGKSDSQF